MRELFKGIGSGSFNSASDVKIFCGYARLPELGLKPRLDFADLIERPRGPAAEKTIYVNQNAFINLADVFH